MWKFTTNLLFVWGPERTTGSNLVAADHRARKSTGVTMRLSAIYSFLEVVCACANTAVQTYYSSITQQPVGRRCQEMLPLCCSAGNDSYSHAVSRQEMYAWAARAGAATVILNSNSLSGELFPGRNYAILLPGSAFWNFKSPYSTLVISFNSLFVQYTFWLQHNIFTGTSKVKYHRCSLRNKVITALNR